MNERPSHPVTEGTLHRAGVEVLLSILVLTLGSVLLVSCGAMPSLPEIAPSMPSDDEAAQVEYWDDLGCFPKDCDLPTTVIDGYQIGWMQPIRIDDNIADGGRPQSRWGLMDPVVDHDGRVLLVYGGLVEGTPRYYRYWDVRVETGIRDSEVLLAVMTPYSTREESICRHEVILAHTERKSIVPLPVALLEATVGV